MPFRLLVFLTLGAAIAEGSLQAQEFRSEAGHFRFKVPADWRRADPNVAAQLRADFAGKPNSILHEALMPVDMTRNGMIIALEEKGLVTFLATYDSIDREMQRDFRREFVRGAPGAEVGNIVLEREKNRFVVDFALREPNGARLRGVMFVYLGKNRAVMIMCMCMENEFGRNRNTFDEVGNSFQFDPGFQFVPFNWSDNLWIIGGAIGAIACVAIVAAVVIVVIVMMSRRRR